MPYHIIVKSVECEVVPRLVDAFCGAPCLLVEENPHDTNEGVHWHFWVDVDWNDQKVRRALDKIRVTKQKGVSVRPWDYNLIYFCKGLMIGSMPKVIHNSVPDLDDERIKKLNEEWWVNYHDNPKLDPLFKPKKVLDELVEQCRDQDYDPDDVVEILINILTMRNGTKMCPNRTLGQSYVRTALLFTKNGDKYRENLHRFYRSGLYSVLS